MFIRTTILIRVTLTLHRRFGRCNWSRQRNERVSRAHIHFAIARLKAQNGIRIYIIDLPRFKPAWPRLSQLWKHEVCGSRRRVWPHRYHSLYHVCCDAAASQCVPASRKATLFSARNAKANYLTMNRVLYCTPMIRIKFSMTIHTLLYPLL